MPSSLVRGWISAGLSLIGAIVAVHSAGVHAADHPPFAPTRDVAVAYQVQATRMPAGDVPRSVRMNYSAASGRLRIEQPSMPGYMLVDPAGKRITMVVEPLRSFVDLPFDASTGAELLLNPAMAFTRVGADRVAGLACTVWDVVHGKTTARLCITGDGVILRGAGSDPRRGKGTLLATAVTYARQPEAMFHPPAGYLRLAMPVLPPGLGVEDFGRKPGKPPG